MSPGHPDPQPPGLTGIGCAQRLPADLGEETEREPATSVLVPEEAGSEEHGADHANGRRADDRTSGRQKGRPCRTGAVSLGPGPARDTGRSLMERSGDPGLGPRVAHMQAGNPTVRWSPQ